MNSYDYLVVGAGSLGHVLSKRLPTHAGASRRNEDVPTLREIQIPAVFPKLLNSGTTVMVAEGTASMMTRDGESVSEEAGVALHARDY